MQSPLAQPDELAVSADTPTVILSTRPAGRNFIRLPDLDYRFAIDAGCPTGLERSAISISIADTRIALGESELTAAKRLDIPVSVPATQIAPVAVDRFCTVSTSDEEVLEPADLTIPAVLSAQVSLLCSGEAGNEMTYAAMSLDVTLQCTDEAAADAPAPRE